MRRSPFTRTTTALLVGYGIYVVGVWSCGVAPGEIAYDRVQNIELPDRLGNARAWARADDDFVVAQTGPETFALVDLDRSETGAGPAIAREFTATGRLFAASRRGSTIDVVTLEDGRRRALRISLEGAPIQDLSDDPHLVWAGPERVSSHGLVDWLVEQTWGVHVADAPGVVSGEFVVVRPGRGGRLGPDRRWAVRPSVTSDDLLVLDASTGEPLQQLDTYRIDLVRSAPGFSGFLLVESDLPTVLVCDPGDRRCEARSLHIRTESYPILGLDHRDAVDRVAACTASELYLYQGDPRDEAIVFAGRAWLEAPCQSLAVLDERTVVVSDGVDRTLAYRFMDGIDGIDG